MWSMPRSVLRVVAALIALCAMTGFVMGVRGTPEKGRLPGESLDGAAGTPLVATDAQPLDDTVVPVPPAPVKGAVKSSPPAVAPADPATDTPTSGALTAPAKPIPKPAAAQPANEDRVGDLLDGITPPPNDPPH